ncbi:protein S40-7-like [Bidens hawaiensis]|uniref:protein S40-7-like n=1 Tax=Bidens hawaiensis TaxID=980011 RepID=UPI00404B6D54
MEPNGVVPYSHRRSPSDRFLGVFSPADESSAAGEDFSEDDVFWTGDFAVNKLRSDDSSKGITRNPSYQFSNIKSGVLAALPDRKPNSPVHNRRIGSPATARLILAIPRPSNKLEVSKSMPVKLQQSAPVNVPVLAVKVRNEGELADVDIEEEDDEEMLPPHELVARASSPHTTFSVLEGAGRTLKGRDLRLVRNAVWRKTGFLD